MSAQITVDGRVYPVPEMDSFTFGELRVFKQLGVQDVLARGANLFDDPDAIAALVIVCKRRAGEVFDVTAIDEVAIGQVEITDDADPPTPNRQARRAVAKSGG